MFPLFLFPSVIEPGSAPTDTAVIIGLVDEEQMDVEEVKNGSAFVLIRGVITYNDVFGREIRTTAFRYFSDHSRIPGLARGWMQCGQPEENEAT